MSDIYKQQERQHCRLKSMTCECLVTETSVKVYDNTGNAVSLSKKEFDERYELVGKPAEEKHVIE